jgi:hypothetical protein
MEPWMLKLEPRRDQRSQIPITLMRGRICICIKVKSWIQIRFNEKRWIRIRIKVMQIRYPGEMPFPYKSKKQDPDTGIKMIRIRNTGWKLKCFFHGMEIICFVSNFSMSKGRGKEIFTSRLFHEWRSNSFGVLSTASMLFEVE